MLIDPEAAMSSTKREPAATLVQIIFLDLKSCLVNLPASVVAVLDGANTVSEQWAQPKPTGALLMSTAG